VLDLIADGLTNRQIGERLFITPKTAGLHVSHILAKLNVDSRLKAAAVAHHTHLEEARDAHDRPAPVRPAEHARQPDA
jgi:DNA-binding NarL/FixJ family response regulator